MITQEILEQVYADVFLDGVNAEEIKSRFIYTGRCVIESPDTILVWEGDHLHEHIL